MCCWYTLRHEEGGGRVGDEGARQTLRDKLVRCKASALVRERQQYKQEKGIAGLKVNTITLFECRSTFAPKRKKRHACPIRRDVFSVRFSPQPHLAFSRHQTRFQQIAQTKKQDELEPRPPPYTRSIHRKRTAFTVAARHFPPYMHNVHRTRAAFSAVHAQRSPYTYGVRRTRKGIGRTASAAQNHRCVYRAQTRDRPHTPNLVVRPSFRAKTSLQHPLLRESTDHAQRRPEAGRRQRPCERKQNPNAGIRETAPQRRHRDRNRERAKLQFPVRWVG